MLRWRCSFTNFSSHIKKIFAQLFSRKISAENKTPLLSTFLRLLSALTLMTFGVRNLRWPWWPQINWNGKYIKLTVLTGGHIEHSVWCTWRAGWTEANVVWIVIDGGEHLFAWRETIAGHTVFGVDFLFECQWQQTAQIFVVHMQRGVLGDVWRENGAISAVQMVAGRCCPMRQVFFAIVFVNDAELCDVIDAREDGYTILQSKNRCVLLFSST